MHVVWVFLINSSKLTYKSKHMKRICSKYFNRLSMLHFNSWPVKKNSVFFLQKLSSTSYTKESILYSSSFDIHLFLHSTIYKTKLNQNQTESKTKLNTKPNWIQNKTDPKTKLNPKQNWSQNKTEPKTKRLMFMSCCVVFVFVEFHTKPVR